MKPPDHKPMRDAVRESHMFRRRALISFVIICICSLVIAGRFFYLQVLQHEEFTTRSEDNRVKLRALPPNRGLVFDRNGQLLADNRPAYRLEAIPEQVEDAHSMVRELKKIVTLTDDDVKRFNQLRIARQSFRSIPLRLRLSEDEVARFAVNRHRFPGVDIAPYQTRVYPLGPELAHVIGYVGRLDASDLSGVDKGNYSGTTHIGKTGIERFYEKELHGDVGHERVETNAEGRVLKSLERTPPRAGADLYLTIDAELQRQASLALNGSAGAIVAVDPRSGEILAMVSQPSYDPNPFVNGVSVGEFRALLDSPNRPLFNRALQGGYEPGSTLKPYIALAGLELGVIPQDHSVYSTGAYQLPGQERKYRDWKREGHGQVDLVQALGQSVNVYFYELAVNLGIDRIQEYLHPFGYGQRTGVDLIGEASGILPSREWKRATHGLPWFPGETVITGIGQGFTIATPLQMAQALAVLASRGHSRQIHLLREMHHANAPLERPFYPELQVPVTDATNWELVIQGMEEVINGPSGTARAIAPADQQLRIAGKTGTAQVYGLEEDEEYIEEEVAEHLRHHALFVAFAPAESPEIAVVVVAEHGGGGSRVAAPIARQVIDAYMFDGGQP